MVENNKRKIKTKTLTLEQIRQRGLKALINELGPVGMIRFLQQYETGWGDYSIERHQWLDKQDVQKVAEEIKKQNK